MVHRSLLTALFALVGAGLLMPVPSDAGGFKRRLNDDLSRGYVVAYSRFGNGSVSGPVRHTRLGPQVRLPGGTWEYCRRSCSETLRVETIDFWDLQTLDQRGLMGECGIFGCLDVHVPY